ncbi:MAG: hypothetical protein Phog2KO_46760 [Phototrophicaceae bacterium]
MLIADKLNTIQNSYSLHIILILIHIQRIETLRLGAYVRQTQGSPDKGLLWLVYRDGIGNH